MYVEFSEILSWMVCAISWIWMGNWKEVFEGEGRIATRSPRVFLEAEGCRGSLIAVGWLFSCMLTKNLQSSCDNKCYASLSLVLYSSSASSVCPSPSSSYSWLIYFLKSLNEHYGVSYWPLWQFQSTGFTVDWLTRLPPPQRDKTSSDSERVRISSSS